MASLSVRSRSATAGVLAAAMALAGAPAAEAKNGDTHITGQGVTQTLDCNNATLLVNGTSNTIYAKGSCWAVTLQGSSNIVVADNVVNDITVYGYDQTVIYHNGAPALIDRGRELGMTNRINWAPA
ncbi:DUF3060 domain-containing protein [Mycolicibacterium neoaurum]|uniref:DUF3060 domain-containing protein n=1 Tax=Mycolicibacterium neoaurum TaxID=1795 RepID=UPI001BD08BD6|nr:DUF3060 domain-containing protein [Mycolicibacterium neoaurum]QVI27544.1 DUF3060 domain-containing protein [Mycolicibacterium neoaurum]